MAKQAVGARIEKGLYDELRTIAQQENRSVSVVVGEMVAGGVRAYKRGGWPAVNRKGGE